MYIPIPPTKLTAVRQIGDQRKTLKRKIEETLSEIEVLKEQIATLKASLAALPTAKQLSHDLELPSCTVRQLLAGRNYKGGRLPARIRSGNRELAARAAAS